MERLSINSVRAFAIHCGLTPQTLDSSMKRGICGPATATKIAQATGCDTTWILAGTGTAYPLSSTQAPKTEAQILEDAGYKLVPLLDAYNDRIANDPIDHFILPKGMRVPPRVVAVAICDDSFEPEYAHGDHIICLPVHPDVCHDNGRYLISGPQGTFITPLRIISGGWAAFDRNGTRFEITEIEKCYIVMYAVAKVK